MANYKKIKVLVIGDSALVRQLLIETLSQTDDIEVVGTAQGPIFALKKLKT